MCESDSSSEEEAILLLGLAEEEEIERNQRKRRIWTHAINKERILYGEYHTLMPQLRKDQSRFYKYLRMTFECFDEILELIKDKICKQDTNYREAIGPEERLMIALRFLATGDSYATIGHSFRMGFTTVGVIMREVIEAIWQTMQPIYLPEPTAQIWEKSAEDFYNLWQFPNCIGSIDGKHVTIKCPGKSGSNFFCYLKKFSINLLAIVGPDYRFLCVDVGGFGQNSDGGILEESNMGKRFAAGSMNVPGDKNLLGTNQPLPHVLIGDEAFALKPTLMRPYPYRQSRQDIRKENFNTRLCRARRLVENAFGILAQKWRIFYRPIETSVETTIGIVKAACVLHNFLRTKNCDALYGQHLEPPEPGLGAFENLQIDPRRANAAAFQIRDIFVNFFNDDNI